MKRNQNLLCPYELYFCHNNIIDGSGAAGSFKIFPSRFDDGKMSQSFYLILYRMSDSSYAVLTTFFFVNNAVVQNLVFGILNILNYILYIRYIMLFQILEVFFLFCTRTEECLVMIQTSGFKMRTLFSCTVNLLFS